MHISTKCSVAIHCLIFICEYGESKKVTSELLSLSTGVNPVTIRNIVGALKKDGILSVKFGTGCTTLNCSLNEITLYRICKAIEPNFLDKLIGIHATPSRLCPVGRSIHSILDFSYHNVRDDLQKSLQNINMEEIMNEYHNKARAAPLP